MHIKYIKVKNFFAIGEEPLIIDFTKCGNVTMIKGRNLDAGDARSNGACKSTIPEAIVYALYGKTIRNISHGDIIHKKSKKGLEVEIGFDNYRVLRTRKPDSLRVWKGEEELTLGGIPATQELLNGIIKLEYTSFLNVAMFGQHNTYDFLSSSPAIKRKIVENLLSLEKHTKFTDIAKEEYKNISNDIKDKTKDFNNLSDLKLKSENRLKQISSQEESWVNSKKIALADAEKQLSIKQSQLGNDASEKIIQYENAQISIKEKTNNIKTYENAKEKLSLALNTYHDKYSNCRTTVDHIKGKIREIENNIKHYQNDLRKINLETDKLKSLEEGAKCFTCMGIISQENYSDILEKYNIEISEIEKNIRNLTSELDNEKLGLKDILSKSEEINSKIVEIKEKAKKVDLILFKDKKEIQNLLSIECPDAQGETLKLQENISALKNKIYEIGYEINEGNPYKEIKHSIRKDIKSSEESIEKIKHEMDSLSQELSYYDFWIDGFSEKGIRSIIINDIIPALNSRISYYLHYLVDDKISVQFDNNLNETITRVSYPRESFVYNSLSGGEKRVIDFAISQAFSYITAVSAGEMPSLCFLDEVGENLDESGLMGMAKLINHLSQDRQIFIITHNPILLDIFQDVQTITMVKKDGISRAEL